MRLSAAAMAVALASLAGAETATDATALFNRGLELARLNKLDEAAATFEEGQRLFPRDKRFPIELAGVSYREKEVARAKHLLQLALKLDPGDAYANEFLGTLYQFDSNLPAALKYWNRAGKPFLAGVIFEPDPGLDRILRARLFAVSGGQVFTLSRLRLTEANLERANVLADVRYDLLALPQDRYELLVHALPKALPLTGWLGRLLPPLRDLPYQGVDFDFYNIRRRALNFTSLWRWDPDKRRLALALAGPLHGNPKIEYRYVLDGRNELWDLRSSYAGGVNGLLVRRLAAEAEFAIGLSPKLQWTAGGVLAYRDFGSRKPDQTATFATGWSATINNRFDYRLWDWPERRLTANAWGLLDAGRLFTSSPSRLIVARAGINAQWLPEAKGDRYRIVQQTQAGRILGNPPLDELFLLGMERDTERDLWLRGVLAAGNGRKGTAPLGREYALSQTTLETRLFGVPLVSCSAGPFFDAGWIGDPSRQFLLRGWLSASGVQAKVRTLGGVTFTAVYGRDLQSGRGAFYTAVSR